MRAEMENPEQRIAALEKKVEWLSQQLLNHLEAEHEEAKNLDSILQMILQANDKEE